MSQCVVPVAGHPKPGAAVLPAGAGRGRGRGRGRRRAAACAARGAGAAAGAHEALQRLLLPTPRRGTPPACHPARGEVRHNIQRSCYCFAALEARKHCHRQF